MPRHHKPPIILLGILLTLPALARAQNAPQANLNTVRGTVVTIFGNKRGFVVNDRSGAQVTVTVNADTKFTLGKDDAKFLDTVVVGDSIKAAVTSSGVAATITNKNRASRMSSDQLKETLDIADDEAQVLVPLIAQIQTQQQLIGRNAPNGSNVRAAFDALRSAMRDDNVSTSDLAAKLKAFRDTQAKVQHDLAAARESLISLVTPRQEAILVQMGILQ